MKQFCAHSEKPYSLLERTKKEDKEIEWSGAENGMCVVEDGNGGRENGYMKMRFSFIVLARGLDGTKIQDETINKQFLQNSVELKNDCYLSRFKNDGK